MPVKRYNLKHFSVHYCWETLCSVCYVGVDDVVCK